MGEAGGLPLVAEPGVCVQRRTHEEARVKDGDPRPVL